MEYLYYNTLMNSEGLFLYCFSAPANLGCCTARRTCHKQQYR